MTLDLADMFKRIQADKDAKKVFLAMPREEQLLAILGMQAYNNNELAKLQGDVVNLRKDFDVANNESIRYRRQREEKENGHYDDHVDDATITQKAVREIKKRFDSIMIVAGILYLIFERAK